MPKGRKETADKTWIKRSFQHILIGKDGNRGENKEKVFSLGTFADIFLSFLKKKKKEFLLSADCGHLLFSTATYYPLNLECQGRYLPKYVYHNHRKIVL